MKEVRRISKKYYLRQIMACWMILCMSIVMPVRIAMGVSDYTLPAGYELVAGSATAPDYGTTGQMHIMNIANGTIINWNPADGDSGFNIGLDALANLQFTTAGGSVLNRDTTGNMSNILGRLDSNGQVYIVNPAGVLFGAGAVVNVTALVASGLELDNDDFINGLTSGTMKFTSGVGDGVVENQGANFIDAEAIAFIGKKIINSGALDAKNCIIMAAGDTVTISGINSNVSVEVTVPENWESGIGDDYKITNTASVTVENRSEPVQIALAAGDIWSTALISATGDGVASVKLDAKGSIEISGEIYVAADPGSDAEATVEIIAGGYVEINDNITTHADNYSDGNAKSTIDIDAGGDVDVNEKIEAWSHAHYAEGNATSEVTINSGGSVYINAEIKSGKAHTNDNYVAGGNAIANIIIDAVEDVRISTSGKLKADAMANNNGDAALDGADAKIDISAGGNVDIEGVVEAKTKSFNNAESSHANSEIFIDAGGYVDIDNSVMAEADAKDGSGNADATITISAKGYVEVDSAVAALAKTEGDSGSATATVDIDAGGDVDIESSDYFKARAEAVDSDDATSNLKITGENIDIGDWIVSRAIVINAGDAESNIDVVGRGDVTVDGLIAKVSTLESGDGTSDIKISGKNITLDGYIVSRVQGGYMDTSESSDEPGNSGDTTASVEVIASELLVVDGVVRSHADAGWNSGSASATTKLVGANVDIIGGGGGDNTSVGALADTWDGSGNATANIVIEATTGNVNIHSDGYDVNAEALVENSGDGFAGNATVTVDIDAGGYVYIDDNVKAEADAKDNSGAASATIDITAGGDVDIESKLEAKTHAHYANGDAISNINISSGGSVYINAEIKSGKAHTNDDDDAGGNAVANIVIDAVDDVYIDTSGKLKADAMANNNEASQGADAKIDISAGGHVDIYGNVEAKAKDFWNGDDEADVPTETHAIAEVFITAGIDSDVSVYADVTAEATSQGLGSTTAMIDIDAGGNVYINPHDGGDTVKAKADSLHTGDADATVNITAVGDVEINHKVEAGSHAREDAGSATSTVNVLAGGNITVDAEIKAGGAHTNDDSGPANANITLDADGGVLIDEDGKLKADSHANDSSEIASSTIDIDAGGAVYMDGKIEAKAHTDNNADDATVLVTIDAGTDVTIHGEVKVDAHANNNAGDASATLEINAGGDVFIDETKNILAKAQANDDAEDATATIDVKAGRDIEFDSDGEYHAVDPFGAYAYAEDGSGNATATYNINAGRDVLLNGRVKSKVESYDSGDATTQITITGRNIIINDRVLSRIKNSDSGDASGTVDILARGDVTLNGVIDEWDYGVNNKIESYSGAGNATANTTITGQNITITDAAVVSRADAESGSGNATANVNVEATGNLDIITTTDDEDYGAWVKSHASSEDSGDATATTTLKGVDITITGHRSGDYDGSVVAYAEVYTGEGVLGPKNGLETLDATAEVTILADGQLTVEEEGLIYSEAYLEIDYPDIDGDDVALVVIPGDATASVTINAFEGITVEGGGIEGSPSEIWADALVEYDHQGGEFEPYVVEGFRPDAIANVDLETCGNVIVDGLVEAYAEIDDSGCESYPEELFGNTTADVIVKAFGDVIVNNEEGSNGQIEAVAFNGKENTAGVTILAVGDVIVNNGSDHGGQRSPFLNSQEEISAKAHDGSTNNAFIRIATRDGDDGDVIVGGQIGARTWDALYIEVEGGENILGSNTSSVEISAARDVIVEGGYALYGQGDGTVLLESHEGGQIFAGAQGVGPQVEQGESLLSSNTAEVDIYAGRDIIVHGAELEYTEEQGEPIQGFFDGGQIIALIMPTHRNNFNENTTHVGLYAQRDVTIGATTVTGDPMFPPQLTLADSGQVIAGSHGNDSINDAEIEIFAQGDVTIDGLVEATAGTGSGLESEHYAHIRIAAGDQLGGTGEIVADADDNAAVAEASVTFFVTGLGNLVFNGEAYSWDGEEKDYEVVVGPIDFPEMEFDWIDWTWCAECEDIFIPAAPLYQIEIVPMIEGCPQLVQAAAMELGVTGETIQVAMGDALAMNPSIQACESCAALVDAANILRDVDGSRMAAMVAAFNALAPADAPFTPATAASIATAFEDAASSEQYASAMEYIDAFVQYVAVLDTGLGSPVGDSVAFVMDKYGAGISGSDNANIASFVAMRLAAIGQ